MCGILGHIGPCDRQTFEAALHKIAHRGPDGWDVWEKDNTLLGHRRLAIIDLSEKGKQPMSILDRYTITFNGEIYNFKELRTDLEKAGFTFTSDSDTEVLLYGFAHWGQGVWEKLNGMWALGIWDRQEQTLYLSRDRIGKKPLYYIQDKHRFIFASEKKALYPFLDQIRFNQQLVQEAMKNVFCYETGSESLIEGIRQFPMGSYGAYANGQIEITKFWKPLENLPKVPGRYEDQVAGFRELFMDACRIRMRSDVPIGTALSGGLDSSATISAMHRISQNTDGDYNRDWQHAFVACFKGSSIDERPFAQKVVDHINIPATFVEIDPEKDIDQLIHYTYLFEELYLTPPTPFIQLYGAIKANGVSVSIDGHGADELFGGYPSSLKPALIDSFPNPVRFKQLFDMIMKEDIGQGSYLKSLLLELRYVLIHKLHKQLPGLKKLVHLVERRGSLDYLNSRLYELTYETVLPTLLRNYDRYAMINSVEIRMPFLDHRIQSYALALPANAKLRNGFTKNIVRDAVADLMPHEIAYRKDKIGFNSPFSQWIQGPIKAWLLDQVHSTAFRNASLINAKEVATFVTDVMEKPNASFRDGEQAFIKLMPYFWEQSFQYAK